MELNNNVSFLNKKKILLGITGSIAAYKAVYICSRLVKYGVEVYPVMTPKCHIYLKI